MILYNDSSDSSDISEIVTIVTIVTVVTVVTVVIVVTVGNKKNFDEKKIVMYTFFDENKYLRKMYL